MDKVLKLFANKYDWQTKGKFAFKKVGDFLCSISKRFLYWDIFFETKTLSADEQKSLFDIVFAHKKELSLQDVVFYDNGILFVCSEMKMGDATHPIVKKLAKILQDNNFQAQNCSFCKKELCNDCELVATTFGFVHAHVDCAKIINLDSVENVKPISFGKVLAKTMLFGLFGLLGYVLFYAISSLKDAQNFYYVSLLSVTAMAFLTHFVFDRMIIDGYTRKNHLRFWFPTAVSVVLLCFCILVLIPICDALTSLMGTSIGLVYDLLWLRIANIITFVAVFYALGVFIFWAIKIIFSSDPSLVVMVEKNRITRLQKREKRIITNDFVEGDLEQD